MTAPGNNPIRTDTSINPKLRRDPEDRPAVFENEQRDKMLDKTLADSFPTSDPPSSIPDPTDGSVVACGDGGVNRAQLFEGLAPGTWVAVSVEDCRVLGVGLTRNEAESAATHHGHANFSLEEVPAEAVL